jgi:hypothetical protein
MRSKSIVLSAVAVAFAGMGLAVAAQQKPAASKPGANTVVVYKSPTCGCCGAWITHLQSHGFQVEANNVPDSQLAAIGRQAGVTDELASCHTAKVGNYVVEGHVPATDIQRMLKEKPAIAGIAVPGMPMGSPGMEQGGRKDPYNVIAFTKNGKKTVFAKH